MNTLCAYHLPAPPHPRLADLLAWKHSGFHIHDGGEKPVPAHDNAGRKRLAEYLLRVAESHPKSVLEALHR